MYRRALNRNYGIFLNYGILEGLVTSRVTLEAQTHQARPHTLMRSSLTVEAPFCDQATETYNPKGKILKHNLNRQEPL